MLIYLLKFSACLAIFIIFYKLVLEKTSIHTFKRFYLLSALILAFIIPSLTFIEYIEPIVLNTEAFATPTFEITETLPEETPTDYTPIILWTIYGLGVFVFLLKFCINLYRIISRIRNNPKYKLANFINVLVKNLITPHTFFSYIFLNKREFENSEIPKEVILHEQAHSKQKHSIDVLLLELSQIIFWFNPLIYLLKRDIKLNHEFLADRAVLLNGIQPSAYQQLLLAFSSNASEPQLVNAINYSSIKKRFTVMKTHTSKAQIWLRSLLILPLIACTLYGFSNKIEIEKEIPLSATKNETKTPKQNPEIELYLNNNGELFIDNKLIDISEIASIYNLENDMNISITTTLAVKKEITSSITKRIQSYLRKQGLKKFSICVISEKKDTQQKATLGQLEEYNKQAKHYNQQPIEKRIIKRRDLERLEILYNIMSDEQKKDAQPFPECPPPPSTIDTIYTYKRLAKRIQTTSKNRKANTIYLEQLYKNMNSNQKKKVQSPQKVLKEIQNLKSSQAPKTIKIKEEKSAKSPKTAKLLKVPTSPKAPKPPKPISRLDHIINMAKKDATFFYKGKSISSDKAIELIKNNDDLNIYTKDAATNKPRVFLTTDTNIPNNNKIAPNQTTKPSLDFIKRLAEKGSLFYLEGHNISSEEAISIINKNQKINIQIHEINSENSIVKLSINPIGIETDHIKKHDKIKTKLDDSKSTLKFITEMTKDDALRFLYNGKTISRDRAIRITKNNPQIHIRLGIEYNTGQNIIYLSKRKPLIGIKG